MTYLENKREEIGKVIAVFLPFKKRKKKKYKSVNPYFRLKFYSKTQNSFKPYKLLTIQNILVKPKNLSQRIKIDVSEYNIPFPENGIFVGVEVINPNTVTKQKSVYVIAPALELTQTKNNVTFKRYLGKKWFLDKTFSPINSRYYKTLNIGLNVKYKK